MILSVEFLFKNQRTLIKKTQDKINNQMARVSFGFTKHFLFPFPFLQTITNKSYHPLFTGFQSFEPKQSENTFKFAIAGKIKTENTGLFTLRNTYKYAIQILKKIKPNLNWTVW